MVIHGVLVGAYLVVAGEVAVILRGGRPGRVGRPRASTRGDVEDHVLRREHDRLLRLAKALKLRAACLARLALLHPSPIDGGLKGRDLSRLRSLLEVRVFVIGLKLVL